MTKSITKEDAASAYNRVISKYDIKEAFVTHPDVVNLIYLHIVKIGYALFLVNEQDDVDIKTLREFCRQLIQDNEAKI